MNKKAQQQGPVGFLASMLFFFIFIGVAGGTLWGLIGMSAQAAGLSGLELFIFNNFGLITVMSAMLGTMGFFYFAGNR